MMGVRRRNYHLMQITIGILEVRIICRIQGAQYSDALVRCQAWLPGQGVKVDHAAIVEILLKQLDDERALYSSPLHCKTLTQ